MLVAWWLIAAATSQEYFDFVSWIYGSWIGRLVLFGYTWALIHHMMGGIRHLVWDTGVGLEKHTTSKIGWATLTFVNRAYLTYLGRRIHGAGIITMSAGNKDMRTPLNKVRGLGSAREGTEHFWRQRLTAIANVPLVLFFVGLLVSLNGAGYAEVRATLANPLVRASDDPDAAFRALSHAAGHAGHHRGLCARRRSPSSS